MGWLDRLFGGQKRSETGRSDRGGQVTVTEAPRDAVADLPNLAAIVDVETTGLDQEKDELIEMAVVLFSFDRSTGAIGRIVDQYVGLREPRCHISRDAGAVHGITRQMVKGKMLDIPRIESLLQRAEEIIAHNAAFDRAFVKQLFPEHGRRWWLCTMTGIDWKANGHESRQLSELAADHHIRPQRAHRGLGDALTTFQLLSQRGHAGPTHLADLLVDSKESKRSTRWTSEDPPPTLEEATRPWLTVLEQHSALAQIITSCYPRRETDPTALPAVIAACEKQIEFAPEMAKMYRKEYHTRSLPEHLGFKQLAIIREKQGDLAEALRLSELAMKQKWDGDWDKRIARLSKRLERSSQH